MDDLFGEIKPLRHRKPVDSELFEALCVACGLDWKGFTKSERGKVNAAAKELKEVGATPSQVFDRAAVYRRTFPGAALTPTAISGQWSYLGAKMEATKPPGLSRQEKLALCIADGHCRPDDSYRCCSRCSCVIPEWVVEICRKYGHVWLPSGKCENFDLCGGQRFPHKSMEVYR